MCILFIQASFLHLYYLHCSTASQQEIQGLDGKIHETVDTINQLKTNREFFLSFSQDPQQFINKWIVSQTRDLKVIYCNYAIELMFSKCNVISYKNLYNPLNVYTNICFNLKTMTDIVGNPEEERRAEFYYQSWTTEAVSRYFYTKVQQKRAELEQALGIRNP